MERERKKRRSRERKNSFKIEVELEVAHDFQQIVAQLGQPYIEEPRFPHHQPVIEFGQAYTKVQKEGEVHYYLEYRIMATALQLAQDSPLEKKIFQLLTAEAELAKATIKDVDEEVGIPEQVYRFLLLLQRLSQEEELGGTLTVGVSNLYDSIWTHVTPAMILNTLIAKEN